VGGEPFSMKNRLLTLLSQSDRERLFRDSVQTWLPLGQELYQGETSIDAIYFPLSCVVSMLAGTGSDARVEVATVGNEGGVGVYSILKSTDTLGVYVVQAAGETLRLDISSFKAFLSESEPFSRLMHNYLFALTYQIVQAGACNRMHTMEERCSRWLLQMHDRMDSDTFPSLKNFCP
jgi:CRP-like cAMP-binding protein